MLNFQIIYLFIFSILGLANILLFLSIRNNRTYKIRMKKNRYTRLIEYMKSNINEKELDNLFFQSGFNIKAINYQLIRYTFLIVWLCLSIIISKISGNAFPFNKLIMLLLLFLITSPTEYLFGRRTPFKYIMDMFMKSNKEKKNIEIYRAVSQLKNIALSKQDEPPSSDFILEQLRKFTKSTRPIFNRVIAFWSLGNKEEACDYLERSIETDEGYELANILRKLDDLKPSEFISQLVLLQDFIRRDRETRKIKENENKSNLVYLVVVTTGMIILINFVIIVYYIESFKQLKYLY